MEEPKAVTRLVPRKSAKIEVMSLAKRGASLPHGTVGMDGKVTRDLACKPWRGKEEREIAKLRAQARSNPAGFPGRLLGFMFTQAGYHNFEGMNDDQKAVVISSMLAADVLYMYIYLRYLCIGKDVRLNIVCDRCGRGFPFTADLETLDVKCVDKPEDAEWTYKLSNPFKLRGEIVEALEMVPMSWATMENTIRNASKDGMENSSIKMDVMLGCIRLQSRDDKGNPIEHAMRPEDLDEMSKRDIEALTAQIEENGIGPDMQVTGRCPSCAGAFVHNLEWGYDNFFGSSSQPLTAGSS